jgi:hypothetical protein
MLDTDVFKKSSKAPEDGQNERVTRLLAYIASTLVLFAMTSCAQLPPTVAVASAMRCPTYPDTQFFDPEKFDLGTLTGGKCDAGRLQ